MERVLEKKVNFSNLVICSLSIVLTSCQITKETNREISRGVFQNHGFCGQAFPFLPTLSPFHFFCSRSNFCAVTQLETLATQAIFWQSLCTWVIFLVISADDQFWTFNECDAMQNLPFHLQCKKKFRLHAFTFSNVICDITWFTLFTKIHLGESVRILCDRCS